MLRRVVASAVLLASLGVPAEAQVQAPVAAFQHPRLVTGQVRELDDYVARGLTPAQAALVRTLDSLVDGGVPAAWVQPRVTTTRAQHNPLATACVFTEAFSIDGSLSQVPAGDLDGDRRPDVLVSASATAATGETTHQVDLTARDAHTGRTAWRRTRRVDNSTYTVALPLSLGVGRAGVLVADLRFKADEFTVTRTAFTTTFTFTALDGRGRQLWRKARSGTYRRTGTAVTYDHYPSQLELLQLRTGPQDLVVGEVTGGGDAAMLRGTVLRAEDGKDRSAFPDVTGESTASSTDPTGLLPLRNSPYLRFGVVPDQDGDHHVDLWTASTGRVGSLSVASGRTGKQVWRNDTLVLAAPIGVHDAGVLVDQESKRHDLAVTTGDPLVSSSVSVAGVPVPPVDLHTVTLLTGGTGELVWARTGSLAWAVSPKATGGVPAVAVASVSQNSLSELPQALADPTSTDARLTVDVVTYDVLGLPVTTASYSSTAPTTNCFYGFVYANTGVGDVDADGLDEIDLIFDFGEFVQTTFASYGETLTISGRTAAVLLRSRGLDPLGVSLDGHGTDRIGFVETSSTEGIRVATGDRGRPLWSANRTATKAFRSVYGYGLPTATSRCADVVLAVYDVDKASYRRTLELLSSAGQPWWTLTYSNDHDVTGTLRRGATPRRLC